MSTPADLYPDVVALGDACREADGVTPFSEATLLALRDPAAPGVHRPVRVEGDLEAYAYLRTEDDGTSWAELAVHPRHRRHGIGSHLLRGLHTGDRDVRVWAHGDLAPARALAEAEGMTAVRDLWVMSRPVDAEPPIVVPDVPAGFTARCFADGDEQEWLRVNAAAFVDHPEQGRMTLDDLRARMNEPWWDPAGLVLIFDDATGRLAASHWTKVADPASGVGEVYVVAVAPEHQGKGLGAVVTALGLDHLARRGLHTIELYVEGDNHPAVATYRRQGFARSDRHVMYAWAPPEGERLPR